MFTAVPPRYDLVNRIITWGQDARWRRLAAEECLRGAPRRVLDLCCGTGDLALQTASLTNDSVAILGVDFSRPMLELAAAKDRHAHLRSGVSYVEGDACGLPFRDGCLDCIGISFAFRNLTYRNPRALRYLAEALRVLRPGGRLVIVESSQPASRPVRRLFHLYLRGFVARIGRLISGHRPAYALLAESAARYYTPGELERLLLGAGFRAFSSRGLMFGAVAIHVAVK
jgi:demethylmenaquinone methyltransferase/2-methoxy-6-polyprenyl-1,4-benzoquinol methylase